MDKDTDYDYLVFEICNRHELGDSPARYFCQPKEGYQIKRLTEIIEGYLQKHYPKLSYIKKFGIQGPMGLKFSLNEEEFQLNSTGIFSLENTNVHHLAFPMEEESKQHFIIDFQY